jgi:hypothetical protein
MDTPRHRPVPPGDPSRAALLPVLLALALLQAGCQSAYYRAMESAGYPKRDILVSRVQDARNAEEGAKEQFQTALDKFRAVVAFEGGELEDKYRKLSDELARCEDRAKAVHDRIQAVESVATALFAEWEGELGQYKNPELRRESKRRLDETRARYRVLMAAMRRAEKRIDPVLAAFRDQVLFLKHNLNARAVASLKGELASVEAGTASLVRDMEASIAEADAFIKAMGEGDRK